MGSLFRVILFLVACVVALFLAVGIASESGEVVVLTTVEPAGPSRETRLWIIDEGGVLWLRAGSPTSMWLVNLRVDPEVTLVRDGVSNEYAATAMDGPELRDWLNHRMAEKYGWADWAVGLMADRSESVPIRLD